MNKKKSTLYYVGIFGVNSGIDSIGKIYNLNIGNQNHKMF
jgi:hypothetical protein